MSTLLTYLRQLFSFDSSHPLLFTQIHFWVFFLIVFAGYTLFARERGLTAHRRICRNGYLFLVSLLFYYKTSGYFVLLLVFSTILGWLLGIRMDHTQSASHRKLQMVVGVTVNLLMLGFFKYAYFFTDIFNATFRTDYQLALHILLPVGISFFTFQNISYIVDVYKRKIAHVGNVLDFGFYTSVVPQLVAGPILRADQFVPQLYKPFFLGRRQFGIAVFWIANGLIKKIVLSDYLAVNFVDRVFDNPLLYTPFENFSALLLYSLQVYADFSGYTDIAIGVAMLMGFYLPMNFNSPYKAQNPTDFWRRWHMSLSRWLRDYLYIPLGGNRSAGVLSFLLLAVVLAAAAFRLHSLTFAIVTGAIYIVVLALFLFVPKCKKAVGTDVNNFDTMLLGGLWHGASFNFITWGGLNGLGILVNKFWKRIGSKIQIVLLLLLAVAATVVKYTTHLPLFNMAAFVMWVLLIGFTVLHLLPQTKKVVRGAWVVWNVTLTFLFISFTRLFFRSGSNLDPVEANEVAWRTANAMVHQIGSHWNLSVIPDVISAYWMPFLLFVVGMVVHLLPARFKRRYRLWFAQLPLWVMAIGLVLLVFVLYQFITADLQPFIYFQF